MTDNSEKPLFVVGDSVLFKYQPHLALWSAVIKELDEINQEAVLEIDGIIVPPPNQTKQDPLAGNLLITRKYLVYVGDLIYRAPEIGDDIMRDAFIKKLNAMNETLHKRNAPNKN
jgi:hypothetical protein